MRSADEDELCIWLGIENDSNTIFDIDNHARRPGCSVLTPKPTICPEYPLVYRKWRCLPHLAES